MAAWDDFKFGVKHRNAFDKIAMMNHLMKGKSKFFKEREKALLWLLK